MYRGCRRLVCSLACVFCILFMLFLDTCIVEASTINKALGTTFYTESNFTVGTFSITLYPDEIAMVQYYEGNGNYVNFTWNEDFDIPFHIFNTSISTNSGTCITYLNNVSISGDGMYLSSCYLTTDDGNTVLDWVGESKNTKYMLFDGMLHGHLSARDNWRMSAGDNAFPLTFTITVKATLICTYSSDSAIDSASSAPVHDTQANESLNNIEDSSESTADNTSGILSKITDFFGSFFENLIGIFVPEDGYFSGWFNRVNTLLSDKLGMLYAPFDLVISTLQAIYSSSSTESGIPFPGIKWEDTWLVEPFTFTFASLGSDFDDLRDKVYFATDTVLVLTFLMLLQSKVKLILEGHE